MASRIKIEPGTEGMEGVTTSSSINGLPIAEYDDAGTTIAQRLVRTKALGKMNLGGEIIKNSQNFWSVPTDDAITRRKKALERNKVRLHHQSLVMRAAGDERNANRLAPKAYVDPKKREQAVINLSSGRNAVRALAANNGIGIESFQTTSALKDRLFGVINSTEGMAEALGIKGRKLAKRQRMVYRESTGRFERPFGYQMGRIVGGRTEKPATVSHNGKVMAAIPVSINEDGMLRKLTNIKGVYHNPQMYPPKRNIKFSYGSFKPASEDSPTATRLVMPSIM